MDKWLDGQTTEIKILKERLNITKRSIKVNKDLANNLQKTLDLYKDDWSDVRLKAAQTMINKINLSIKKQEQKVQKLKDFIKKKEDIIKFYKVLGD
jgi:predicted RNase H-like nuclease (RuvC/YqgF family)